MNTKGIKFLAVLAVLAMAFAAVAVVANVEDNDAATGDVTEAKTITLLTVTDGATTITGTATNYGVADDDNNTALTINLPTSGSGDISIFIKKTGETAKRIDVATPNDGTTWYTGSVKVYIASAVAADSVKYVKTGYTEFSFTAINQTKSVSISVDTNVPTFTAAATTQEVVIPVTGVLIIPATTAVTANVTAAAASGNAAVFDIEIEDTNAQSVIFTNTAGVLAQTAGGDAATIETLTLTSGKFNVGANTVINTYNGLASANIVAKITTGTAYAPGTYSTAQDPAITYVYNEIGTTSIYQAAAGAITLVNAKTVDKASLSVMVGTTEYRLKLDRVSGTVTGPTLNITDINAAGYLEFVKGTFAGANATVGARIEENEGTVIIDEGTEVRLIATTAFTSTLNVFGKLTITPTVNAAALTHLYVASTAEVKDENNGTGGQELVPIHDMPNGKVTIGTSMDSSLSITATDLPAVAEFVIPADMYLEVKENLYLGDTDLIVKGELRIGANAQVNTNTGKIIIDSTGSIVNNGIIGKNQAVTIQVDDANKITTLAIKGVEVAYEKIKGVACIDVAGDIVKVDPNANTVVPTLTLDNALIYDLEIMNGVTLAGDGTIVADEMLVTNTGSFLEAAILVPYKATISVNGYWDAAATITTQTFIKQTTQNVSTKTYAELPNDETSSKALVTFVTTNAATDDVKSSVSGFTISVDRVQYSAKIAATNTVCYDQRAYIMGDLKIVSLNEKLTSQMLTIAGGNAFVAEDTELTLYSSDAKTITLPAGTGDLVVLGTVNNYLTSAKKVVGVKYDLKVDKETITYVEDFAEGIAMLGLVDTITLRGSTTAGYGVGSYTLTEDLEIDKGETVAFADNASLIVPKDRSIIVNEGGTLNAKVIATLSGKVVVKNGTCSNMTTEIYQVMSTAADGTKTYAGLEIILAEAQAGDEILFPGDNALNVLDAIDLKEGVTLKVTGDLHVIALTVEAGAKVTMTESAHIYVQTDGTKYAGITVLGTFDTTGGEFTFTGTVDKSVVKSTGELIFAGEAATVFVNATIDGAIYINKDTKNVLTSIENAIEADADVEITEKYDSAGTIELNGKNLTVDEGAEVKIATLDITGSENIDINGTFTGTIVGIVGVGELVKTVSIKVTEFTGEIKNGKIVNAQGDDEYSVETLSALTTKNFEISSGVLVVKHNISAVNDSKASFKLAEGATLKVSENSTINNQYKSVALAGTVEVAKNKTLTINSLDITISGDAAITGTLTTTGAAGAAATITGDLVAKKDSTVNLNGLTTVTGTIAVDKDATAFNINGKAIFGTASALGAGPIVTGTMTLGADTFVIVYNGAITAENFDPAVDGVTTFQINGANYFEAYFNGAAIDVADVLAIADFSKIKGLVINDIRTDTKWKNVATDAYLAAGADLADELVLNYGAAVTQVVIKTSWATGLSMYIDGIRIVNEDYALEVGTHTVKVVVNPGYKGTNMVTTYKGATITDKITVGTGDANAVLSATGDITIDTVEPSPAEKEAFGITEILLVVLVILIAVMVIIVLLRMNRS